MGAGIRRCGNGDRLQDAARSMLQLGCDALPICSTDGRLEGQLDAKAIYQLVCLGGVPIKDLSVANVPVADTCNCLPDTSVADAYAMLVRTDADWIYVVDDRRRLLGFVGRKALALVANLQVERIRRRNTAGERRDESPYDGWTLLIGHKQLIAPDGSSISIQRNLLRLLLVFMRRPGRTLTRHFLMKRVCNREWSRSDRYIDVLIGQLRRKFWDDPVGQRVIRTAYGSGYVFLLDVERPPSPVRENHQVSSEPPAQIEARAALAAFV